MLVNQSVHDRLSSCTPRKTGTAGPRAAAVAALVPDRRPIDSRDGMTVRGFGENNRLPHRDITGCAKYIEHRILRPFKEHRCTILFAPGSAEVEETPIEMGSGNAREQRESLALMG